MPDFSTRARPRRARPWELVLLVLGFVAVVASAYDASAAWAELRVARTAADDARRESAALTQKLRTLESGHGADELAGKVLLTAESPPPRVLADLAALMPAGVRLDGVTLSYGQTLDVSASIMARDASTYDAFLKRLGASAAFADLVPGAENRDGEVRASLRMTYRGGAP